MLVYSDIRDATLVRATLSVGTQVLHARERSQVHLTGTPDTTRAKEAKPQADYLAQDLPRAEMSVFAMERHELLPKAPSNGTVAARRNMGVISGAELFPWSEMDGERHLLTCGHGV